MTLSKLERRVSGHLLRFYLAGFESIQYLLSIFISPVDKWNMLRGNRSENIFVDSMFFWLSLCSLHGKEMDMHLKKRFEPLASIFYRLISAISTSCGILINL